MKVKLALLAAWLFVMSTAAQAVQPKPLFAASDPIHIVIQAPLSGLIHNRSDSVVQGTLTDPNGQALPVALTVRGITRRSADVCDFPPLRVQFATAPPPASLFAGQKRLKLVTHCRNNASFQQYVLLEYSIYRMYNLLTPHSFRVRLANIDYLGADGRPIISRVGYFLEDLSDVAKRNGMKQTHAPKMIPETDLSPSDAARYALLQHMISNHDWSMRAGPEGKACCHNAELIGPLGPGTTIPIPYDFDFSGFVNAPYATVPDQLHISSVRERVYRGYCIDNSQVPAIARQMRDARPQMISAITSTPGLDPNVASRAISFLDGFFADIATDDAVNSKLLKRCVN
ncbi:MAG TPA: hypothetical protein VHS33_08715 [Sphingomicrobium sp.]|jgi:hypothetical protein|nr:hypothetical protein [Sphingomicrobium sp.]